MKFVAFDYALSIIPALIIFFKENIAVLRYNRVEWLIQFSCLVVSESL